MLKQLPQKFPIQPIIDQVIALGNFGKRLDLNTPAGEFFNDPWQIKSEFVNTPLGKVLTSLGYIGQARLLCLNSGESYTAHTDPDDRIHLAIQTNEFSYIVDLDENKLHHLSADGQLWYMDTGKTHVAANWGPRTRIHLNIRVLLPKYNPQNPGMRIKVVEGEYDWKQLAYTPIMRIINHSVKQGHITGFKGIDEKEILINVTDKTIFDRAFSQIKNVGITLEINDV
jgi:hypothetical protein